MSTSPPSDHAPKTVLITGCSSGGVGSELAKQISSLQTTHSSQPQPQFHVFATLRSPSKIDPELGSRKNVTVLALDVVSPESIAEAVESVRAHASTHSREKGKDAASLDILINNAGLGHHVHALDYDDVSARNVFDVDYWGTLAVTKAFAPLLIEAGKAASRGEGGVKGKGVVVNVCSVAALTWVPTFGIYSPAKAAQRSLSRVLRLELRPLNIRVLAIMMGGVASNFGANTGGLRMPADSLYRPVYEAVEAKRLEAGTWGQDQAAFVRDVVQDVLRGREGEVWRGAMAALGWWVERAWVPAWLLDWLFTRDVDYGSVLPRG